MSLQSCVFPNCELGDGLRTHGKSRVKRPAKRTIGTPRPWTLRSRQGRSPGSRVVMAVIPSRWLAPVALFDRHSPFTVAGAAPALIALQAIAPASLLASGPDRSEGTLIGSIGPAGTPVSILARANWPLCALREPNSLWCILAAMRKVLLCLPAQRPDRLPVRGFAAAQRAESCCNSLSIRLKNAVFMHHAAPMPSRVSPEPFRSSAAESGPVGGLSA